MFKAALPSPVCVHANTISIDRFLEDIKLQITECECYEDRKKVWFYVQAERRRLAEMAFAHVSKKVKPLLENKSVERTLEAATEQLFADMGSFNAHKPCLSLQDMVDLLEDTDMGDELDALCVEGLQEARSSMGWACVAYSGSWHPRTSPGVQRHIIEAQHLNI